MQDYRATAAPIIKEFLTYQESVCGHSLLTIDAYYSDLKLFIKWIHMQEKQPQLGEEIDLKTLAGIQRTDIYEYTSWMYRDKKLAARTRARRIAAVRALYKYLTVSTMQLTENPTIGVSPPKYRKSLPVYLTESEADQLLAAPTGTFELRDRTILLLFLSCGVRVSELVGLNIDNIHNLESITVLGKGNKERELYLSESAKKLLKRYLEVRRTQQASAGHENALFLSQRNTRISVRRVQSMVDERLKAAGLDATHFSPHKLRHTAATGMLRNGVDVRVLQAVLGHEQLNTTEIYTHIDNTDLRLAAQASPFGKGIKE